jgi:hypothetical protein
MKDESKPVTRRDLATILIMFGAVAVVFWLLSYGISLICFDRC